VKVATEKKHVIPNSIVSKGTSEPAVTIAIVACTSKVPTCENAGKNRRKRASGVLTFSWLMSHSVTVVDLKVQQV
jgi:hypothetical protein